MYTTYNIKNKRCDDVIKVTSSSEYQRLQISKGINYPQRKGKESSEPTVVKERRKKYALGIFSWDI